MRCFGENEGKTAAELCRFYTLMMSRYTSETREAHRNRQLMLNSDIKRLIQVLFKSTLIPGLFETPAVYVDR